MADDTNDDIRTDGHDAHDDELEALEGTDNKNGFEAGGPSEADLPEDLDGDVEATNMFNGDTI